VSIYYSSFEKALLIQLHGYLVTGEYGNCNWQMDFPSNPSLPIFKACNTHCYYYFSETPYLSVVLFCRLASSPLTCHEQLPLLVWEDSSILAVVRLSRPNFLENNDW